MRSAATPKSLEISVPRTKITTPSWSSWQLVIAEWCAIDSTNLYHHLPEPGMPREDVILPPGGMSFRWKHRDEVGAILVLIVRLCAVYEPNNHGQRTSMIPIRQKIPKVSHALVISIHIALYCNIIRFTFTFQSLWLISSNHYDSFNLIYVYPLIIHHQWSIIFNIFNHHICS